MIDQRTEAAPASPRERPLPVFDSKVDRIRPTYGFEDVSLAPGSETVEPNGTAREEFKVLNVTTDWRDRPAGGPIVWTEH